MGWFRTGKNTNGVDPKIRQAYIMAAGDINNYAAAALYDNSNILAESGSQPAKDVFALLKQGRVDEICPKAMEILTYHFGKGFSADTSLLDKINSLANESTKLRS